MYDKKKMSGWPPARDPQKEARGDIQGLVGHTACLPVPGQVVVHFIRGFYICILIFFLSLFAPGLRSWKRSCTSRTWSRSTRGWSTASNWRWKGSSNDIEMRLNYLHRITKFFKRQQGLPPVPRLVQFCCVNVFYIKKMFRMARLRTVAFNPLLLLK